MRHSFLADAGKTSNSSKFFGVCAQQVVVRLRGTCKRCALHAMSSSGDHQPEGSPMFIGSATVWHSWSMWKRRWLIMLVVAGVSQATMSNVKNSLPSCLSCKHTLKITMRQSVVVGTMRGRSFSRRGGIIILESGNPRSVVSMSTRVSELVIRDHSLIPQAYQCKCRSHELGPCSMMLLMCFSPTSSRQWIWHCPKDVENASYTMGYCWQIKWSNTFAVYLLTLAHIKY